MTKEEFKQELEKYGLDTYNFLDLHDAWYGLTYSCKEELLREDYERKGVNNVKEENQTIE